MQVSVPRQPPLGARGKDGSLSNTRATVGGHNTVAGTARGRDLPQGPSHWAALNRGGPLSHVPLVLCSKTALLEGLEVDQYMLGILTYIQK